MNKKILISIAALLLHAGLIYGMETIYTSEIIRFTNQSDLILEGTLRLAKTGKNPVIILISGSGPATRTNGQPFLELADHFARLGVATFCFDKRGCGNSEGMYFPATTFDFASDVESAIDFLLTRPDIDAKNIGLFGHSEGGLIAAMLGAKRSDITFLMLYAPPGIGLQKLGDLRRTKMLESAAKRGLISKERGELYQTILNRIITEVIANNNLDEDSSYQAASEVAFEEFAKQNISREEAKEEVAMILNEYKTGVSFRWTRAVQTINPADHFANLHLPVLLVNGTNDFYVPYEINVPAIAEAFARAQNNDITIFTPPLIGHNYAICEEYGTDFNRREIDASLVEIFTKWLSERIKKPDTKSVL